MAPSSSQDGQVGAKMEPKMEGVLSPSWLSGTRSPPPRTPPPLVKPPRGAPATAPHAQAKPELSGTADICPAPAADIRPVSTADICPVSTEDSCPVSTEDATAPGLRPAAVMSSAETE